jgi:uncharacterized protein
VRCKIPSASLAAFTLCIAIAPACAKQARPASDLERFSGVYELAPGQFLYIEPWPSGGQGGGQLTFTDDAGTVRALFPESNNRFTAGPGFLVRTPTQLTLEFIPDSKGQIARLAFQEAGSPPRAARKLVSYKREAVHFQSGKERLAGILLTPPGKGPHPALVLVHGTGATDRYTVLPIVQFLLSHGMALLGYDKRGVGESTGDWHAASLNELAADAAAAVQFLSGHKDIDSRRIGIFGASQGGWIAPLAASRSPDIAYVITVSGPAISPAEVDRDLLERGLRARNFPEAEIERALDFLRLRDAAVRDDKSVDTFLSALAAASAERWFPYASMPRSIDRTLLAHWSRLPLNYNPGPAISKLRVPVLVMFGELDQTVVPAKNAAAWQVALQQGGVKDSAIKIFPRANHMLLEARSGSNDELPLLEHFVPDYAPFLLDWLRKHSILHQ